jgi:hypothetical protein
LENLENILIKVISIGHHILGATANAFPAIVMALLVLFAVLPAIPVVRATPSTLVVDDDGFVTATDCDDPLTPAYTSIQVAINAASDGDEIIVCPGTYAERITISKNGLTVRSFDGSAVDGTPDTVIKPGELTPAAVVISGNDNKFIGFYIKDTTSGHGHAHRGIFVQGDRNLVEKNLVEGRGNAGPADIGILVRNELNVGDGVAEDNSIIGNEVTNIFDGIATVSVASNRAAKGTIIQHNNVHYVFNVGVAADKTPDTSVMFNEIVNNKIGVKFNSRSDISLSGAGTIIKCNNIYDNVLYDAENIATDGSVLMAEYNWWGSAAGPDLTKLLGAVEYDPWLTTVWEEAEECRPPPPPVKVGRMTGGGFIVGDMTIDGITEKVRLNFGFELHCDASKVPNNLQINWRPLSGGPTYIFHLESMNSALCFETPADQGMPLAPFDTHVGSGTGRFKMGNSPWQPATISWRFVDAEEPGAGTDELSIVIVMGSTTYSISGKITGGNIQAHSGDP